MEYSFTETTMEKILIQQAAAKYRPITGTLELLPLCNMACDMCYIRLSREEMEHQGSLHTAEEWIRLAEEMQRSGVLFLLLTGGEPLLFPDFKKLYRELLNLGMILTINTNGTLLDENWADFFSQYRPRRVNITLYGADHSTYESLCHYPEGFSKAFRAIKLLKMRNIDVKINGSVTRANRKDLDTIYQIGHDLDIPVHMDTYLLPGLQERNLPFKKQSRLSPEDAAAANLECLKSELSPENFLEYAKQTLAALQEDTAVYPEHISCQAGQSSFAIGWQGMMRPCVSFPQSPVNVFELGFEAAWSKISSDAQTLTIHQKCTRCRLRPVCNTCAASALLETGNFHAVPSYHCRYAETFAHLLQQEYQLRILE